ncbi:MAG TPA: hypothetical protein VJP80_04910 [Candidatus Saccharimonadales bacterium]|nr:hypothetical protein [Candidatus Saccharimonadales bacterium]
MSGIRRYEFPVPSDVESAHDHGYDITTWPLRVIANVAAGAVIDALDLGPPDHRPLLGSYSDNTLTMGGAHPELAALARQELDEYEVAQFVSGASVLAAVVNIERFMDSPPLTGGQERVSLYLRQDAGRMKGKFEVVPNGGDVAQHCGEILHIGKPVERLTADWSSPDMASYALILSAQFTGVEELDPPMRSIYTDVNVALDYGEATDLLTISDVYDGHGERVATAPQLPAAFGRTLEYLSNLPGDTNDLLE